MGKSATHEGQCPKCRRLVVLNEDGVVRAHRTIRHQPCQGGDPIAGTVTILTPEISGDNRDRNRVYSSKEQRRAVAG